MKTQHSKAEYTLTDREVQNIINSTKTFRNRCIIKTSYYTAVRREELTNLRVGDIDFDRKTLTVHEGKGGKTRTVPFIDMHHLQDLKHLIGKRREGPLFISGREGPLSVRMINYIFQKAGEAAGVTNPDPTAKHINPHLFRHSIARELKKQNYRTEFIQKLLGHKSQQTTMDTYGTMSLHEMQQLIASRTGDHSLLPETRSRLPELPREAYK